MSGQDRKQRILSDLKIVSSLQSGQTLSASTMTVIAHGSWSSSMWRKYAGESRKDTISSIKNIFMEAILILETNPSQDLIFAIDEGLKGFNNLKETYQGDYLTIVEINRIISEVRNKMNSIGTKLVKAPTPISVSSEENVKTLEERVVQMVRNEIFESYSTEEEEPSISQLNESNELDGVLEQMTISDSDQKISADENTEKGRTGSTSNTQEMVPTSNRKSYSEAAKASITGNTGSNGPKNSTSVPNIDIIHLITEKSGDLVPETSQSITKRNPESDFKSDIDESEDYSDEEYRQYEYIPDPVTEQEIDSSPKQSLELDSETESDSETSPIRRSKSANTELKSYTVDIDDIDDFSQHDNISDPSFIKRTEPSDQSTTNVSQTRPLGPILGLNMNFYNPMMTSIWYQKNFRLNMTRNQKNGGLTFPWIMQGGSTLIPFPGANIYRPNPQPPPIVRLAHAFRNWIDTIRTSDENMSSNSAWREMMLTV